MSRLLRYYFLAMLLLVGVYYINNHSGVKASEPDTQRAILELLKDQQQQISRLQDQLDRVQIANTERNIQPAPSQSGAMEANSWGVTSTIPAGGYVAQTNTLSPREKRKLEAEKRREQGKKYSVVFNTPTTFGIGVQLETVDLAVPKETILSTKLSNSDMFNNGNDFYSEGISLQIAMQESGGYRSVPTGQYCTFVGQSVKNFNPQNFGTEKEIVINVTDLGTGDGPRCEVRVAGTR